MRLIIFLLTISLFISCKKEETKAPLYPKVAQTPEQLGKEIFEGKGNCVACHQPEQKIVGPSILEIAQIYKDKNASIVAFLKEKSDPLVNPDQYEVMKTNFAITKSMSDEELKAVEAYMYSNLK
jgi:cytochrome c